MPIVSLIFAMSANRVIGNQGGLPWHLPSDLNRFKNLTIGHPVIMGRKTFESILARNGKPLSNRQNIIITRDTEKWSDIFARDRQTFRNCLFVSSLAYGIDLASSAPEVFIIGGAEIYAEALPIADRLYFTQIPGDFKGDVKFPLVNMNDWKTAHDELVTVDKHPYAFSILHNDKNLVNPTFAKSAGYGNTISEIIAAGICPFCPDTFLWHPWPILHRVNDWFITRSGWPYENSEHHLMIIGEEHITLDIEMSTKDLQSVRELTSWACDEFDLEGYLLASRSGNTNRTGATVQHLHFHLIQPKLGPDGRAIPVYFPIG
jgi:dihydrofolate reductase